MRPARAARDGNERVAGGDVSYSTVSFSGWSNQTRISLMVRRYAMDIIHLVTDVAASSGSKTTPVVTIRINGRRLVDLIRDVELSSALHEGHANLAGAYVGIPPMVAFLPSRHLLGEPAAGWDWQPEAVPVLQCECGEPGCWPLLVCIAIGSETVTWSDFRQPHRGPQSRAGHWRYDALPGFTFDRRQYEEALRPQSR